MCDNIDEGIMLREISQTGKDKYCIIFHVESKNKKYSKTKPTKLIDRTDWRLPEARGLWWGGKNR